MGVPREDLLLMTRALKRGLADVKAIRKALDRQVSKPISLLEALHLGGAEAQALRGDPALPDPLQDRANLEALHAMLLDGEHLTASEWEKFMASLTRPSQRQGWAALAVPQDFDGYSLQWELARRERGVVFRARDGEGRDVAIKVFRKDVPVTGDLPRVDGHPYAVMPFVDGEPLESKKPGSTKRAAQAVERAAHLLRSLDHGALTPARILVRKDDSVVVIGFEHARAVPLSARAQAYAGAGKADVHALGAILYELLTGSPPAGETSPAARSRDVDADLDRIVSCALSGGYESTSSLADDLGHYLRGEPVTARRAAAAGGRKKRPWALAAAAAALLVAGVAAAIVISTRKEPVRAKERVPEEPPPAVRKPEPPPEPPKPPPRREIPKVVEPPKPLTPEEDQRLYEASLQAMGAGDWERVVAVGNEAVSRGSKKDWALHHLATAYSERDELDKALEYATRAFQAASEKREALEKRAEVHVLRGEAKKAAADLEALHGKKPAEYNRQILRLSKLVKADPNDGRSFLQRGVYYVLKKHFKEAQDDFDRALALGRKSALAWRAGARAGLEDRAGAEADAKAYLGEMPTGYAAGEMKALLAELGGR